MKTYQLKPETIARLTEMRERPDAPYRYYQPHRNCDDILNQRLWQYYAKPKYHRRTDNYLSKSRGTWATPWPPEGHPYASRSDRPYYADSFDGFREIGDAHQTIRLDHTGWYCNPYQGLGDLAIGVVLQLPARNRTARYAPAVRFTESDGVTIYPLDWHDEKEDAARAADQYAEFLAEREREDQEGEYVKERIAELHDENKSSISRVHTLKMDLRQVDTLPPTICDTVRSEIRSLRRSVTENIRSIKKVREEPWSLFS